MSGLPSGTVTFLFSDIEGSTRLWDEQPDAMPRTLARHDDVVRSTVGERRGHVVKSTGDGTMAVFVSAADAIAAAVTVQRALGAAAETSALRVRMGLHSGHADERDDDYFGATLNRAARIMGLAHGGQVLVSHAAEQLTRDEMPDGVSLVDLGEHRLRDLSRPERLFQVAAPGLAVSFPPVRSLDAARTNLPTQLTTFIGRDDELRALLGWIQESRVVTLTGVGGVGKSRLALQAAAEIAPEFRDGAWFVELGPLSDPDALAEVAARVLGVRLGQGQAARDLVLGHLAPRALLLVLDNCEHLLSSVAGLVHDVVRRGPDVRVLATSREALGLTGERIVGVPSLAVPTTDDDIDASTESVRLLVERASLVRPDFRLDEENAAAIAHICRRLDGIPLALELAAARLRSMTPLEVADRLDHRFRLLTGGRASATGRHQTLRAAIDWSYDLLGQDERRVLQRCAVFAGGFDLDAAEAVCAHDGLDPFDIGELLTRLVDKSLLVVESTSTRSRYRMLETIRDHTLERRDDHADVDATRRLHAAHYAEFAARAGAGLRGRDERVWLERVERELANLQLAVTWAIEQDEAQLACDLVAPLAIEMLRIDHAVGGWAELVAALPSARALPHYAQIAAFAAFAAVRRGDVDAARAWRDAARAALAIVPHGATDAALGKRLARVLDAEMIVTMTLDGADAWARVGEERVAVARRSGDDWEVCRAVATLAVIRALSADDSEALAREALTLATRTGNPTATCSAWFVLGHVVSATDPALALQHLAAAERAGWDAGNDNLVAVVNGVRGYLYVAAGTLSALPLLLQSLEEQVQRGYPIYVFGGIIELVAILAGHDRDEAAATLYGFWDAQRPGPLAGVRTGFDLEGLDAQLRAPHLAPHLSEGAALPNIDAALAFARRATEAFLAELAAQA